jgi:hypothetical protein
MKEFPPLLLPARKLTGQATASTVPDQLMTARYVYVRRGGQGTPLALPYSGPYQVLRPGEKVFKIAVGDKEEIVTVDRLKPHTGDGPLQVAWLPRRGQPPKSASELEPVLCRAGSEGGPVAGACIILIRQ